MPPLRDRLADIPLLVNFYIDKISKRLGKSIGMVPAGVMDALQNYHWPGNIRELKFLIQSAVNLSQGRRIEIQHLPEHLRHLAKSPQTTQPRLPASQSIVPLEEVERAHILNTYNQLDRNKSKTARALRIGLNTLRRKLELYGET